MMMNLKTCNLFQFYILSTHAGMQYCVHNFQMVGMSIILVKFKGLEFLSIHERERFISPNNNYLLVEIAERAG